MTATKDDWGSPTLYAGGQPFEPRMFTEADPMGGALGVLVDTGVDLPRVTDVSAPTPAPTWSEPTYVGRARKRRTGPAHAAPEDDAEALLASADTSAPHTSQLAAAESAATETGAAELSALEAIGTTDLSSAESQENTTRGLMAASGSIAVASLASRVTGFLRSILLLAALGTAAVGDAYNSGNNLPNMIYELLLGGVLSSVLIPLLVQAQSKDDDDGIAYTQRLLSLATVALGALTLGAVALAPVIAAGFVPAGSQRELAGVFATLLLPEIFFYGLGAMFVAVLNIRHSYRPGAWAPVLNNVIMIVTLGVFWALPGPHTLNPATITTPQILVVGIGTTLGIAGQALVLIPSLRRSGFTWAWRFRALPHETGRLREVGTIAGWVLAYVVISQIGVSVIQRVGVANGGFTVFTNADLLFQMPYGILVVSLLTAIMPRMSRAAVRGDNDAVIGDLSLGTRLSALAMVPVTAGLIALGPAFTVTIFAYGKTSIASADLLGSALAWSAFGLFPFAVVMLQLRVFYAMRDGKTPTLINAFMVATKVVLVLVTSHLYRAPAGTNVHLHPSGRAVEWLNIATSCSYVVGAVVGHIVLTRRLGTLRFGPVVALTARVALASAAAGAIAYGIVRLARGGLGGARLGSFAGLAGGAVAGVVVLVVLLWLLRIDEVRTGLRAVRRRRAGAA